MTISQNDTTIIRNKLKDKHINLFISLGLIVVSPTYV